jgi:hypothetical protein
MLAVGVFGSWGVDDIVVRTQEAEGEGDKKCQPQGSSERGVECIIRELVSVLVLSIEFCDFEDV